jgi:hypothetical protein
MSPRTIPEIRYRDFLNPEESAVEITANTPGPGLAARIKIAAKRPVKEKNVIY